jgi:chromosome segregation ATPase
MLKYTVTVVLISVFAVSLLAQQQSLTDAPAKPPVIATATSADTATQYANDAVASMQQEYDALASLVHEGKLSTAELQHKSDELFKARLLLLTLKHDDDAISTLLREQTETFDKAFARLRAMGNKISAEQVQLAELKSLQARLQYATHNGDAKLADATLNEAIAIEEAKLQSVIHMVKRGFENHAAVAGQKLRLARFITHREISLP